MSNTHNSPQPNTEEATQTSNANTLLSNIYANVDVGLTFDAASEIIEKAKNKMSVLDSTKIELPSEEALTKRQWSKVDVKKFNLHFNGKKASEILDFGFVITEVDGKKVGHVAIKNFADDILINENFVFVSTKVFKSFSSKIMAYISSILTGSSFNNCKFTDMNLKMTSKLISILQAGLDSTGRVDDSAISEELKSQISKNKIEMDNSAIGGKGNKWHNGIISNMKIVYLYEVDYDDGDKDLNIPSNAIRVLNESGFNSDKDPIQIGTKVQVLSWQDRFAGL